MMLGRCFFADGSVLWAQYADASSMFGCGLYSTPEDAERADWPSPNEARFARFMYRAGGRLPHDCLGPNEERVILEAHTGPAMWWSGKAVRCQPIPVGAEGGSVSMVGWITAGHGPFEGNDEWGSRTDLGGAPVDGLYAPLPSGYAPDDGDVDPVTGSGNVAADAVG